MEIDSGLRDAERKLRIFLLQILMAPSGISCSDAKLVPDLLFPAITIKAGFQ